MKFLHKSKSGANSIVLDDMILTKDMPTTAGSKMLENYMSLFDATVVEKLAEKGYDIAGKANVGEFSLDFLGETSYFAKEELKSAICEIIKEKDAKAGISLEVNGSNVRGAALSNLNFLKPTYAVVSRFGTIPAACSGETVGITAENAETLKEIYEVIAGHDTKDGTSLPEEMIAEAKTSKSIKKIAVMTAFLENVSDEVKALIEAFKAKTDVEFTEISDTDLLLAKPAWNTLLSAELCNNVSKYDGVKYGYRTPNYTSLDELYTNSRTEAFGYLTKSTILYGSETLSDENYMKVYDKALRIRRILSEYMENIFKSYDLILLPAVSKTEYTLEEAKNNPYLAYDESLFTAPAMITGNPVVVTNGVQLIGNKLSDMSMIDFLKEVE
ncbi:MAG: amidase family protein [Clostridia bacterium]|nr:amidase family protein [Clostridia bacterium]